MENAGEGGQLPEAQTEGRQKDAEALRPSDEAMKDKSEANVSQLVVTSDVSETQGYPQSGTERADKEGPPDMNNKRSQSFDEEALERRKKRRRLRKVLKEAGEFPSFVALISAPEIADDEEDDDEANENEAKEDEPEVIYIDVDEYLGLNKGQPTSQQTTHPPSDRDMRPRRYPDQAPSTTSNTATPAEEGYYEGRVHMALPEDSEFLSPLQQLIRKNLELFSASATDIKSPQYGRRAPIVLGKVGVRCVHCARVSLEAEAAEKSREAQASSSLQPDNPASSARSVASEGGTTTAKRIDPSKIWPPGSVSYPMNISGLHSLCSQKPQLHFDQCPNLPAEVKAQVFHHLHDASKRPEGRSRSREIPTSMYYVVSAKRLGLVNVADGIRFGRDLNLDPLPLDAVMAKEKQEAESLPAAPYSAIAPQPATSMSSIKASDPTAQQVLEEAMNEPDDPERTVAKASDKSLVTDFIFLCIRQMSMCRAVPADFATRGKKTKKMRIGFAGFCCRHCQKAREEQDGDELARAYAASDYSCRSFSSEADNLASAISNSFALHLQKCTNVPRRMKAALATFKRMHPRQMAQLEYGSQRRLFNKLWSRLRAADIPEEEMLDRIKKYKPPGHEAGLPIARAATNNNGGTAKPKSRFTEITGADGRSHERGPDFPVSNNPETLGILKAAETNWDINDNDGLIQPSDRDLISDYVFLTMRHLHVAIPNSADLAKARRPTVLAGLCCIHCDEKEQSMSTAALGRTFPSQPDNYASALNSSMYNHMQSCNFIPADIKRALADVRKLHSGQCQRLAFGAQRRYFNILYNRLKKVPLPDKPKQVHMPPRSSAPARGASRSPSQAKSRGRVTRGSENSDDSVLAQFGYFEAPCQSFFCTRCRMVPLPFRARGSICFSRPAIDFMSDHSKACKENGFDLWFVVESLKKLLHIRSEFKVEHLTDPLFKELILTSVGGNEDLANIFTTEIVKVYQMSRHGGVTNAVENYIKAKSGGLWCKFPTTVDSSKVLRAFAKFSETVEGMSPNLHNHRDLVTYLQLISPSLNLPEDDADDSDEDGSVSDGDDDDGEGEEEEEHDDGSSESYEDIGESRLKPVDRKPRGKELKRKAVQKSETDEDKVEEDMVTMDDQELLSEEGGAAGEHEAGVKGVEDEQTSENVVQHQNTNQAGETNTGDDDSDMEALMQERLPEEHGLAEVASASQGIVQPRQEQRETGHDNQEMATFPSQELAEGAGVEFTEKDQQASMDIG